MLTLMQVLLTKKKACEKQKAVTKVTCGWTLIFPRKKKKNGPPTDRRHVIALGGSFVTLFFN
jgi:hypothetical protein